VRLLFNAPSSDDRRAAWRAKKEWHRWFAWHPVVVPHVGMIWLEPVQRRMHSGYNGSWYEYSLDSKVE